MIALRRVAATLLSIVLLLFSGCASLAPTLNPPAPATGAPGSSPAAAAAHSSPAAAPSQTRAAFDTVPSPEAERVLASIPEPLTQGEASVAPPAGAGAAALTASDANSRTGGAIPDSDSVAVDTTHAIPTPAPTAPLGDRPGELERILSPDSANAAADSSGRSASKPGTPRDSSGSASRPPSARDSSHTAPPGECWRLQVGASSDRAGATRVKQAAESQLELPFDLLHAGGLYKVRTHDCLDREATDHLRARASAAGFTGVFVVKGASK